MKKLLWMNLVLVSMLLVALIVPTAIVGAVAGIDSLEAYQLALQTIVALAQHGIEGNVDIVTRMADVVVRLFQRAIEP